MNIDVTQALGQKKSESTREYAELCLKNLEQLKERYQKRLNETVEEIHAENERLETYLNELREDLEKEGWRDEDINYEILCQSDSTDETTIAPLERENEQLQRDLKNMGYLTEILSYYLENK